MEVVRFTKDGSMYDKWSIYQDMRKIATAESKEDADNIIKALNKRITPYPMPNRCKTAELGDDIFVVHPEIPPHKWDGEKFVKIEFEEAR